MRRLIHTATAVLLSVVVLTGTAMPPAVLHAHAGGDQGHCHAADEAGHSHDARHAHAHDHHHVEDHHHGEDFSHQAHARTHTEDPAGDTGHHRHQNDDSIEAPTRHLHLSIAWFDVSVPLPVDEHSNDPCDPLRDSTGDVEFVRLNEVSKVAQRVAASSAVEWSLTGSFLIARSGDEDRTLTRWLVGRGDRTFLCDTARRERSGVELIFD